MSKRQWSTFFPSVKSHLTATNAIVGIIGVLISATGASMSAQNLLISGIIIVVLTFLYAIFRSIPPKLKSASDFVGRNISIDELQNISPTMLKVGIVGSTQSGKTTFLQEILQQVPEPIRTNNVYASVVALQTTPPKYVALLDGDGDQFSQQFEVAENADFLLIFLDHSLGSKNIEKSTDRIKEHDVFIKQLISHIKKGRIKRAHVLLNKRDLWESTDDAYTLEQWFNTHIERLRQLGCIENVKHELHSNLISSDVSKIMRLISSLEI